MFLYDPVPSKGKPKVSSATINQRQNTVGNLWIIKTLIVTYPTSPCRSTPYLLFKLAIPVPGQVNSSPVKQ